MPNLFYEYERDEIIVRGELYLGAQLGYLKYNTNKKDILTITNFFTKDRNSLHRKKYNNHVGTELFNELLKYLQKNQIMFKYIDGKLSTADANNNNWLNSIPFYANFCNYIDSSVLGYKLEFYIYKDCNRNIEIVSTTSKDNWHEIAKDLCSSHKNTLNDLYFRYILLT